MDDLFGSDMTESRDPLFWDGPGNISPLGSIDLSDQPMTMTLSLKSGLSGVTLDTLSVQPYCPLEDLKVVISRRLGNTPPPTELVLAHLGPYEVLHELDAFDSQQELCFFSKESWQAYQIIQQTSSSAEVRRSAVLAARSFESEYLQLKHAQQFSLLGNRDIQAARARLAERAAIFGLQENENIDQEGDCQFDAAADQLTHYPQFLGETKESVRARAVQWIREHADHDLGHGTSVRQWIELLPEYEYSFDQYLSKMSRARYWGDEMTLLAIREAYGVCIVFLSSIEGGAWFRTDYPLGKSERDELPHLWLGHEAERHYWSLVPLVAHPSFPTASSHNPQVGVNVHTNEIVIRKAKPKEQPIQTLFDGRVKLLVLNSLWQLDLQCPAGFTPASLELEEFCVDQKGFVPVTPKKGRPKEIAFSLSNDGSLVTITAVKSGTVAPLPCTSLTGGGMTLLRFKSISTDDGMPRCCYSCPLVILGNDPGVWTSKRKEALKHAASILFPGLEKQSPQRVPPKPAAVASKRVRSPEPDDAMIIEEGEEERPVRPRILEDAVEQLCSALDECRDSFMLGREPSPEQLRLLIGSLQDRLGSGGFGDIAYWVRKLSAHESMFAGQVVALIITERGFRATMNPPAGSKVFAWTVVADHMGFIGGPQPLVVGNPDEVFENRVLVVYMGHVKLQVSPDVKAGDTLWGGSKPGEEIRLGCASTSGTHRIGVCLTTPEHGMATGLVWIMRDNDDPRLAEINEGIDELRVCFGELEGKISTDVASLKVIQEAHVERIYILEAAVGVLQNDMGVVKERITVVESDLHRVGVQVQSLEGSHQELHDRVGTVESQLSGINLDPAEVENWPVTPGGVEWLSHLRQIYSNFTIEDFSTGTNLGVDGMASSFVEVEVLLPREAVEPLDLKDLWKSFPIQKRIILRGAAGMGKTTLLKKLCYDWATANFWSDQFTVVVFLQLRRIDSSVRSSSSLFELLKSGLGEEYSQHIHSFLKWAEKHPSQILWIMDGWDEIAMPVDSSALSRILYGQWSCVQYLIAGTRTECAKLFRPPFNLLDMRGFSTASVRLFIRKCFEVEKSPDHENEDENVVLGAMARSHWLEHACHQPLILRLVCLVARSLEPSPTVATIYDQVITSLFTRHLERLRLAGVDDAVLDLGIRAIYLKKEILPELCKLAWTSFRCHEKVVTKEEIVSSVKSSLVNHILKCGLLKEVGPVRGKEMDCLEWVHYTFQDYFAARYVCQFFSGDVSRELCEIQKREVVPITFFQFVCSIGGKALDCLDQWFPKKLEHCVDQRYSHDEDGNPIEDEPQFDAELDLDPFFWMDHLPVKHLGQVLESFWPSVGCNQVEKCVKPCLQCSGHLPDLLCEVANYRLHHVLAFLLRRGGNPNARDDRSEGMTLLHYMCKEGNAELVQLLLEKRADIRVQDRYGWTPLHFAAFHNHQELLNTLCQQWPELAPRSFPVRKSKPRYVKPGEQ